VLWGFKSRGSGYPPNIQLPLAAKLCVRPQKFSRGKNVLEVLHHRAKFGGAPISPAAGTAKNVEFFISLFLRRLFLRHAFECQRLCARFRHEGVGAQKLF